MGGKEATLLLLYEGEKDQAIGSIVARPWRGPLVLLPRLAHATWKSMKWRTWW